MIAAWFSSLISQEHPFPPSKSLTLSTSMLKSPLISWHYLILKPSAATKHRSVGATNLNRASSRSHAVLTIEVSMLDTVANMSKFHQDPRKPPQRYVLENWPKWPDFRFFHAELPIVLNVSAQTQSLSKKLLQKFCNLWPDSKT
jgi:hypothetical protein